MPVSAKNATLGVYFPLPVLVLVVKIKSSANLILNFIWLIINSLISLLKNIYYYVLHNTIL